jgi:hypothetical protein
VTRVVKGSQALVAAALLLAGATRGAAQELPQRIPLFVVDLHANIVPFPSDSQPLADSRALSVAELPGVGFGGDVGVHIYPLRWRAVTFGLGGQVTVARSHQTPDPSTALRAVTARFTSVAPQISFNFGSGTGWSYVSGGISGSKWTIVPDGFSSSLPADTDTLKTINYGGGARWFIKRHVAFSFDIRFYAISPSATNGLVPGSPRATLTVFGAGVSLK